MYSMHWKLPIIFIGVEMALELEELEVQVAFK